MQKIYIEQETQTEIQQEAKYEEPIQTESKQSIYEGPFYLMFGPQNQLLLVSAKDVQQNTKKINGIQITLSIYNMQKQDQNELQKQHKYTYKLSRKQPKMIDYLVKRNTNVPNTQLQQQLMLSKLFQPILESPVKQQLSATEVQSKQNLQKFELNIPSDASECCKLPILVICSFCKQVGTTKVTFVANQKTYFYSLILCLTLPFLVCLPFYVDNCQQAISQCQNCGKRVETAD